MRKGLYSSYFTDEETGAQRLNNSLNVEVENPKFNASRMNPVSMLWPPYILLHVHRGMAESHLA